MSRRKSRSRRDRVKLFEAHNGTCHLCSRPIQVGEKWEWSHPKPLALGGEDTLANSAPAHARCHRDWTAKEDRPRIDKARRQHADHIGANAPKRPIRSRGFPKQKKRGRIPLTNTLPLSHLARAAMEENDV